MHISFPKLTLILSVLALSSCHRKPKYFEATGIMVRTIERSNESIWTTLNDKERVDGYTRIGDSIFGGEISCNVEPLKNVDIKTFQVLAGTKYAKDKNHVYYPLEILCLDYTDCGVCYYSRIIMKYATPASFQYLGKDYATDGNLVFFRGEQIQTADGASFKVFDGPPYFYFAADKYHVYKRDRIFAEADPATFYVDPTNPGNKNIIGDKNNQWEYIPPDQIIKIDKK